MNKLSPQVVLPPGSKLPDKVDTDLTSDIALLTLAAAALVVVDYTPNSGAGQLLFYVEETSDDGTSFVALTTSRPSQNAPIEGFAFDVRRALWLSDTKTKSMQMVVNLADVTSVAALRKIRVQLRDIGDPAKPGTVGVTILTAQ
jgi:hypothetical protein